MIAQQQFGQVLESGIADGEVRQRAPPGEAGQVGQDFPVPAVDAEHARGPFKPDSLQVPQQRVHRGGMRPDRAPDGPADADDTLGHVATEEGDFGFPRVSAEVTGENGGVLRAFMVPAAHQGEECVTAPGSGTGPGLLLGRTTRARNRLGQPMGQVSRAQADLPLPERVDAMLQFPGAGLQSEATIGQFIRALP